MSYEDSRATKLARIRCQTFHRIVPRNVEVKNVTKEIHIYEMQEEEEELEWQWANSGFGLPVIWASWRGTGRDARVYSNEQMTGLTLGGPTNVAYVADDHPTNGEVVQ